ncbi:MAG: hypothetical protein WB019_04170, partial [Pseudolabrys sp.]
VVRPVQASNREPALSAIAKVFLIPAFSFQGSDLLPGMILAKQRPKVRAALREPPAKPLLEPDRQYLQTLALSFQAGAQSTTPAMRTGQKRVLTKTRLEVTFSFFPPLDVLQGLSFNMNAFELWLDHLLNRSMPCRY